VRDAPEFIYEQKLWRGMKNYKWLMKTLVVGSVLLGLMTLESVGDHINQGHNFASMVPSFSLDDLMEYFNGSHKYLILIVMEIVIFHFTRRTMMIVTQTEIDTSFNTFITAEKRMIQVAFYSFILESVWRFVANTSLSILDITEWMIVPAMLIIESFYLGFAVIDNYNELLNMSIKQSHKYTFHHAPVAVIIGFILFLILKIPILGVLIGPVICAVIATLIMHEITAQSSDMAWVYVVKEKKSKKSKKKNKKKKKS